MLTVPWCIPIVLAIIVQKRQSENVYTQVTYRFSLFALLFSFFVSIYAFEILKIVETGVSAPGKL